MTLSDDVQRWVDWQNDQFMVIDVQEFSADEAEEFMEHFDDIPEGESAGWYARLSAPGYMDCTEWDGPYETEEEAIVALYDMFGDDMPDDEEEE